MRDIRFKFISLTTNYETQANRRGQFDLHLQTERIHNSKSGTDNLATLTGPRMVSV